MKRPIFLVLLFVAVLTSCSDFLDEKPSDQLDNSNFWDSENDLEIYVNQFYTSFGNRVTYYTMDNNSDNAQPQSPDEILNGTRSIPSGGGNWNWGDIRAINIMLENIDNVEEGDENLIEHYTGEGYFFRAYFYFDKLKRFGDVPIYKESLDIDSDLLEASRNNRQDVFEFILEDLDKAISLLNNKSETEMGRVNKESAQLLKSRAALYEGTWEKYHNETEFGVEEPRIEEYLEIAANTAEDLIDNSEFALYDQDGPEENYRNAFNKSDLTNNEEAILSVTHGPEYGLGVVIWNYLNGARSNGTGMTKQLINDYLTSDGKPISVSSEYQGDSSIEQVTKNRDPRLKQSIWVPGMVRMEHPDKEDEVFKNPRLTGGNVTTTGYMIRKGSNTDPNRNKGESGQDQDNTDGYVFRYAEALLNFAEAKAELGEIDQTVLDKSINRLRNRVGMPKMKYPVEFTDPYWDFPDLDPIINEIRRERRVELAFEGFRHDDLMRWAAGDLIKGLKLKGARIIPGVSFPNIEDDLDGIHTDENHYIWHYKNSVSNGFGFNKSRDYLYPIPSEELKLNSNLKQNPGWD